MTKLIEKNDPRYFSQTSDKLYDRHNYKIVSSSKTFIVESWQEVQEWWWNNCNSLNFDAVDMLLINQEKNLRGFNETYTI